MPIEPPSPSLRHVSSRSTLPLPRRTRLLRELSDDLQSLTGLFVAEGLALDEARLRASEVVLPDGISLERLERLHQTLYRRLSSRLPERALRRFERITLAGTVAAVLAPESLMLFRSGVLSDPSPFVAPVLLIGSAMLAASAVKAFGLWIAGDHSALRRGLYAIPLTGALATVVSLLGALVDSIVLAATLEGAPELARGLLLAGFVRESKLVALGLLFLLAGGLFWLVANQWIVSVEEDHARVLEADSSQHPEGVHA